MLEYDIIIVGSNVTGLWLAGRLRREGFNIIVIENKTVGADAFSADSTQDAKMNDRWDACFEGWGDLDLASVKTCGDTQIMWPENAGVSGLAVAAATRAASSHAKKLKPHDFPEELAHLRTDKNFKTRIFSMPHKTPDPLSLVTALAAGLQGRILKGEVQELLPDGQIAISGTAMRAQMIVFAEENHDALGLMRVQKKQEPRAIHRQITVKPMIRIFNGTAVTADLAARVTVSSIPLEGGGYAWRLGGLLAAEAATHDDAATFAKQEMEKLFPNTDWRDKDWTTADIAMPPQHTGPRLHQRGRVLIVTDRRSAFAPSVCDRVHAWMQGKDITPRAKTAPPPFPPADARPPPEPAPWRNLP